MWTEGRGVPDAGDGRSSSLAAVMNIDGRVHHAIIRAFVEEGHAPDVASLTSKLGLSPDEVVASQRRLHEGHGLVLHPGATASGLRTRSPHHRRACGWRAAATDGAPCVWCAMGIVALAAPDAVVHVRFAGEAKEARIVVQGGELASRTFRSTSPHRMRRLEQCHSLLLDGPALRAHRGRRRLVHQTRRAPRCHRAPDDRSDPRPRVVWLLSRRRLAKVDGRRGQGDLRSPRAARRSLANSIRGWEFLTRARL